MIKQRFVRAIVKQPAKVLPVVRLVEVGGEAAFDPAIDLERVFALRSSRDPEAVLELVRLAELLAIPVMESTNADRLNFPMTHWAYGTGPAAKDADVLLVMEDVVP